MEYSLYLSAYSLFRFKNFAIIFFMYMSKTLLQLREISEIIYIVVIERKILVLKRKILYMTIKNLL